MKTAEKILDEKISEIYDRAFPDGYKQPEGLWYNGALEAMKAYALAAIQEDRKDCAEKAKTKYVSDYRSAIGVRSIVDKSSILDRPLPDLQ
jgi:hypothetical protein